MAIYPSLGVLPYPPFEVSPSSSFADTLKRFDAGGMAIFEAKYDRVGVFGDVLYLKISDSASVPLLPPLTTQAQLNSSTTTALLTGTYRVLRHERGSLDLMLGARYWSLDNRVRVSEGVEPFAAGFALQEKLRWASPVIGAKGSYQVSDNAYLTAWTMVGGFGINNDVSWDAMAAFGYSLFDNIDVVAGYRVLSIDYSGNNLEFDAVLHGMVAGLSIHF